MGVAVNVGAAHRVPPEPYHPQCLSRGYEWLRIKGRRLQAIAAFSTLKSRQSVSRPIYDTRRVNGKRKRLTAHVEEKKREQAKGTTLAVEGTGYLQDSKSLAHRSGLLSYVLGDPQAP